MELSKEELNKRLLELKELEKKLWAELNSIIGAEKEVLYWLKKLEDK